MIMRVLDALLANAVCLVVSLRFFRGHLQSLFSNAGIG